MITHEQLSRAMNYITYRELLDELLKKGKTTGHDQGPDKLEYAKINIQRMARLDKTVALRDDLKQALEKVNNKFTWLVITEGWCGDTAQNIPVLYQVEKFCPNIKLRLILRDDNPDVMDMFLTNGARSIPKLICIEDRTLNEVFTWGPRPAPLQEKVMEHVRAKAPVEQKGLLTQTWYNGDKTNTLQLELLTLVNAYLQ